MLRLKILCNTWPFGNSSSRIFRKVLPMLVATFLLNGGLYQMISLWRFFLSEFGGSDAVGGENARRCLYPLALRDF